MTEVVIRESWPSIPGQAGGTSMFRAKRKAVSSDGRFWLVKKRGLFYRWQWCPVDGMFVTLHEVA